MSEPVHTFPHNRLDVYRVAIELAVLVHRLRDRFPRGNAHLADDMNRAAQSVVCNIAEGANRLGAGEKRSRFSIARGEAGECAAAAELAGAIGLVPSADAAAPAAGSAAATAGSAAAAAAAG